MLTIEKLEGIINDNLPSIYDLGVNSVPEFLYLLTEKLNSVITNVNYLVNDGLVVEVVKKLNIWLDDGTLANIINNTIFSDLNNKLNSMNLNILIFGAKPNDITFDNSIPIQKAIDYCYSNGGGNVFIPQGKWYCLNTINLKGTVTLVGASIGKPDNPDDGTSLIARCDTLINAKKDNNDLYYRWSIGIKNIGLYSELSNNTAINLYDCSYSRVENVHIGYFGVGIKINGGMLDTYKDIAIFACTQYGIKFEKTRVSTTQIFENAYIGQMVSGVPLYLEKGSCIDLTLNRPTFESSPCAVISDDDNCNFTINDIYVENIPRTINGVTQGILFSIGNVDGWKGTFTMRNGIIIGNNTDGWRSTVLFDFKTLNNILIDGVQWNRVGAILTDNSLLNQRVKPVFTNCNSEEGLVLTDLDNIKYKDKIIIDKCCVKSKQIGITTIQDIETSIYYDVFGGGYSTPTIKVNSKDRIVFIEGMVSNKGSNNGLILTIPDGIRPSKNIIFSGSKGVNGDWSSATFNIINGNLSTLSAEPLANYSFYITYNY